MKRETAVAVLASEGLVMVSVCARTTNSVVVVRTKLNFLSNVLLSQYWETITVPEFHHERAKGDAPTT